MRAFSCNHCGQVVFFGDYLCLRCLSPLGYVHDRAELVSLVQVQSGALVDLTGRTRSWQRCAMNASTGCNWLVPFGSNSLCGSCVLTRTRPADSDTAGIRELIRAEAAKRRLLFQLADLGLPVQPRDEDLGSGLAFDLLSSSESKVVTGHDNGLITLDLAEADTEHREKLRRQLGEPYRTLLGHFRHEIGHYYWPILVWQGDVLDACRALFGDDRADYGQAVSDHYAKGDDDSWSGKYISQYATMHPYEDWAETFAHYLHIHDTLQTARSFGLQVEASAPATFGELIDQWVLLSQGLNEVNRSMGREFLYPFVISPLVMRKLAFVDRVLRQGSARP